MKNDLIFIVMSEHELNVKLEAVAREAIRATLKNLYRKLVNEMGLNRDQSLRLLIGQREYKRLIKEGIIQAGKKAEERERTSRTMTD